MRRLIELLTERHLIPLAGCSLLAILMLYSESQRPGGWNGPRLHLNLFLAWIPYILSIVAVEIHESRRPSKPLLWLTAFTWFIFFPNAPYLITDFAYLNWTHSDVWQRVGIFTVFSLAGLLLANISLLQMHMLIRARRGRVAGWVLVGTTLGMAGLGVFMGRFLRLNSWEVFQHPGMVVDAVKAAFDQPIQGVRPLGFSLHFSAILFVVYYTFLSLRLAEPTQEEIEASWR